MTNTLKRFILLFFCILTYLVFISQSNIDRFVDDFKDDKSTSNVVYTNYKLVHGDLNIASRFADCPDDTVFFIADKRAPLVAKYNIYNTSQITVSFYSTFGSFSTKNEMYDIYHLGYNDNSDNSTTYPIYLYNGRMYTITQDNKVYTSYSDPWFGNCFKQFGNEPDLSQLGDKLGISISVGTKDNNLHFVQTTLNSVDYIDSAGLYYHTVTANIPEKTEFITVSLRDVDQIYDDSNNVIVNNQNFFSAIAKVDITGNDIRLVDPDRVPVSGSTLPYYPEESSKTSTSLPSSSQESSSSLSSSQESSSLLSSSSSSASSSKSSSFVLNLGDDDFLQQPDQTYAKRTPTGWGYNPNVGRSIVSKHNLDETSSDATQNWNGTNVLQYVSPSSSKPKPDESSEISKTSSITQSLSENLGSYTQVVEYVSSQENKSNKNSGVIISVAISTLCIISTQIVLYI